MSTESENIEVKEIHSLPDIRMAGPSIPKTTPFGELNNNFSQSKLSDVFAFHQSHDIINAKEAARAKEDKKDIDSMSKKIKKTKKDLGAPIRNLLDSFELYADDLVDQCNVVNKLVGHAIDKYEPEKAKEAANSLNERKKEIKALFNVTSGANEVKSSSIEDQKQWIADTLKAINCIDIDHFEDLKEYAQEIKAKTEAQLMTLERRMDSMPKPKITGSSKLTLDGKEVEEKHGSKMIKVNDRLEFEIQDDLTPEEERFMVAYYLYMYKEFEIYKQKLAEFSRKEIYRYTAFVAKQFVTDPIKLAEMLRFIEDKPLTMIEKVIQYLFK